MLSHKPVPLWLSLSLPLSLCQPTNWRSFLLALSLSLSLCGSARSLGLAKKTTRQNEFQLRANFCCAWTSLRAKKKPLEANPNPKLESRNSNLEPRNSKRSKRALEISARRRKKRARALQNAKKTCAPYTFFFGYTQKLKSCLCINKRTTTTTTTITNTHTHR